MANRLMTVIKRERDVAHLVGHGISWFLSGNLRSTMIAKDGSHLIDAFATAAVLDAHLIGGGDAQLDIGEDGFFDVVILEG